MSEKVKSCADCGMKLECARMPCFTYDFTAPKERSCASCISRYACAVLCPRMK